ncbi:hypothetical protein DXX99_08380 [Ammonifex thiophilus]|uniref:Uncharacterized protein n=1 Tax=Ammonifex thiophilus TaxID=444093 RepID=A0A3D8P4C6_9THEO|nr:hypothetical protein DXX99_08380 [Ammonifex thiophilus]
MLWACNQPFLVMIIYPALFLALVSDSASSELESNWFYLTAGRISSRVLWCWSKNGAVALLAVFFTALLFLGFGVLGGLATSFGGSWSRLVYLSGWKYPGGLPLSCLAIPPPLVALRIFLLLSVGLAALGAVALNLALVARRAFWGWAAGVVLCLLSYGAWHQLHHPLSFLLPSLHLLLAAHRECNPSMPSVFTVPASMAAGAALFLIAGMAGRLNVSKRDL